MMRKWNKKTWLVFVLFCLILSLLSLYPYWLRGVNLEHDTCFHISRIAALAQSFRDGDLLPRIFPYQNNGFGYASPLFYSNTFLVLPALCALAGLSIARCYQLLLLLCSFFTCFNMGLLMRRVAVSSVFLSADRHLRPRRGGRGDCADLFSDCADRHSGGAVWSASALGLADGRVQRAAVES